MSVTWEPTELMDPHHVIEDNQGLTIHFVNLAYVLSDTGHVFKDGERCGDFSIGYNSFTLIIMLTLFMCTTCLYEMNILYINVCRYH